MCVCVCVCVYVAEKEGEGEKKSIRYLRIYEAVRGAGRVLDNRHIYIYICTQTNI